MRHRLALIVGSLAATATLTVALAASGFGPAAPPTLVSAVSDPQPTPQVQVDTIYVAPPQAPETITIRRTIPSSGEPEGNEGGSDD